MAQNSIQYAEFFSENTKFVFRKVMLKNSYSIFAISMEVLALLT